MTLYFITITYIYSHNKRTFFHARKCAWKIENEKLTTAYCTVLNLKDNICAYMLSYHITSVISKLLELRRAFFTQLLAFCQSTFLLDHEYFVYA